MSEFEPGSPCGNCVGACCRQSVILPLSQEEAETLRAVGTSLKELLPAGEEVEWGKRRYFRRNAPEDKKFLRKKAHSLEPGQGFYGLESDCGFLEEAEDGESFCGIHDNEELRPDVCGEFTAGSFACRQIRRSVITKMVEEDSFLPSLVGIALGEEAFQALEAS